ncbi:833_t:CDS:2, partial [Cetraspora pellucida]
ADSEYNNLEYSDPELLVYESESSNEKEFNNSETELSKEEAEQLVYENRSMSLDNFFKPVKKLEVKYKMSDSDINDSDIENNSSILKKINKLSNNLKDMKNMNAYEYLHLLAVHKYLAVIFNHEESHSHIKLSLEISQQVFQRGSWMACHICIYYDGHECSDVIQYCAIFLEKMKDLETLMSQFVGENIEIIINPEISKEKQMHILVTYD